jgi:hypothetical protein
MLGVFADIGAQPLLKIGSVHDRDQLNISVQSGRTAARQLGGCPLPCKIMAQRRPLSATNQAASA